MLYEQVMPSRNHRDFICIADGPTDNALINVGMDAGFDAFREAFEDRWLGWFRLAVLKTVNGAL